jgi:succinate dehydrogenase (ubiquinone) membrane anchor subunit
MGFPAMQTMSLRTGLTAREEKAPLFDGGADDSGKSHWIKERWLSVVLIPLFPLTYAFPGAISDYALAILVPVHNHMGLEVFLTDYAKGALLPIAKYGNYALGAATIGGLCYFNFTDIGICAAMAKLWAL